MQASVQSQHFIPGVLDRLQPELGAEHAVDEAVPGTVDDQQEVTEVADHQGPKRERLLPGIGAFQRLLDHEHLVQAEEDPRQVRDEKDQDDAHEDDGQVVLLPPTAAVVLDHAVGRQREGPLPLHAGR